MKALRFIVWLLPVFLVLCRTAVADAPADLVAAEYFFDTDLGVGTGVPVVLTSGQTVDTAFDVPATGLAAGWHKLYVRVQDGDGVWSLREGRAFFIQPVIPPPPAALQPVAAEYFFDLDPGLGKGTAVAIPAGPSVDAIVAMDASGVSAGWHLVFVRVIDAGGNWSLVEGRSFYVQPVITAPAVPFIVGLEYFYDTEPGPGAGTRIAIDATATVDAVFSLSPAGLTEGQHTVYVRLLDSNGNWSFRQAGGRFSALDTEFHTVTFTAGPYGSLSGALVQQLPHGTATTAVTATPEYADVFRFAGWTGDVVSSDNPLVVTAVQKNLTIVANFAPIHTQQELDAAVAAAPGPDRDGDGFTDAQELAQGTDPDRYTIPFAAGWNNLSIARAPTDNSANALFPFRLGSVWIWNAAGGYYQVTSTVLPNRGHWVYSPSAGTVEIALPGTVTILPGGRDL